MKDDIRVRLERAVRSAQVEHRVPAVQVALCRGDRDPWTFEVGTAGGGGELTARTQFRIGSVTKTFTAVLVMQCRDDGLLDLDDPLSAHVDVPAHGDVTLRRLLSHTSGLQREPFGDVWESSEPRTPQQALADVARAERVLPPSRRFHYSNLGFGLLGLLVAAKRGVTWAESLTDRILRPLGLDDVTTQARPDAAVGYLVDAYSDHARPEPPGGASGFSGVGQLWATAGDMSRWAAFLADPGTVDPDGAVLAADTIEEMSYPHAVREERLWRAGMGLGLQLAPQPDRVLDVGHGGAMPGFLADVYGRRGVGVPAAAGAAVLLSSGTASGALALRAALMDEWLALDPPEIVPWRPEEPAPEAYRSILGRWWGEGFEYVFSWRRGRLEARGVGDPAGMPPATFAPEGADLMRTVSGREVREQLRLTRDDAGRVVELHWATYRFTRQQETFGGISPSEP